MNIGVIGAGSWGTTCSIILHDNGHNVTLWSYSAEDLNNIRETGRNLNYLPRVSLPKAITLTGDAAEAASAKDVLVIATPSQFVRSVFSSLGANQVGTPVVVNLAKGIEQTSLKRMSEVVFDVLPALPVSQYAVLSGPSHAEEVSEKMATSVVAASSDPATIQLVQQLCSTDYFRVYGSSDVIGVELGGSIKNVIAIGAGICDGAAFGDNTKAALITRGIAEIRRLGVAMGAEPDTFAGLSGLGDLIVTTMSRHSRNRYVGEEIGKGKTLKRILSEMKMVAEGVETTRSARDLAEKHGVEMPITSEVYKILFEDKHPVSALRELMNRQPRDEVWS